MSDWEAPHSGTCQLCGKSPPYMSARLGICPECLHGMSGDARPYVQAVHTTSRTQFSLPVQPPRHAHGIRCTLCSNGCVIGESHRGFCALRANQQGRLIHLAGTPARGFLHWYRDPLPTNCVADWVCEGRQHPGDHNLAVFYASCTANCLFCQNWHFREMVPGNGRTISAKELADMADAHTFCVCFFGGDPSSQMPHALAAARLLANRGIRICWETNGTMHPKLLNAAVRYALQTGGCIKFDLKAFDNPLHQALTGFSNRRTFQNFASAARQLRQVDGWPLVIASTLLVPGYIEARQVGRIAGFIASIDSGIPYALLAFAPQFYMSDLPCTSSRHAREAEAAARHAGLTNVHVGNRHLLDRGNG